VLKHILLLILSTLTLLSNICTLDITKTTLNLECEDESLNLFIEYDQGENAKGKLTKITDSSGSTQFAYDKNGNIITKTQTIDKQTFTIS